VLCRKPPQAAQFPLCAWKIYVDDEAQAANIDDSLVGSAHKVRHTPPSTPVPPTLGLSGGIALTVLSQVWGRFLYPMGAQFPIA